MQASHSFQLRHDVVDDAHRSFLAGGAKCAPHQRPAGLGTAYLALEKAGKRLAGRVLPARGPRLSLQHDASPYSRLLIVVHAWDFPFRGGRPLLARLDVVPGQGEHVEWWLSGRPTSWLRSSGLSPRVVIMLQIDKTERKGRPTVPAADGSRLILRTRLGQRRIDDPIIQLPEPTIVLVPSCRPTRPRGIYRRTTCRIGLDGCPVLPWRRPGNLANLSPAGNLTFLYPGYLHTHSFINAPCVCGGKKSKDLR